MPPCVRTPDLALQNMLRALAQPSALIGAGGEILCSNADFLHCLGRGDEDITGQSIGSVVRTAEAASLEAFLGAPDPAVGLRISVVMPSGLFRMSLDVMQQDDQGAMLLCQLTPDHAIDSSRLRFLLERLEHGVWSYNVIADEFTVTDAWRRMRGAPLDESLEFENRNFLDQIHPDDRDMVRKSMDLQISGEQPKVHNQYRRRHRNGHWIWINNQSDVMVRDHLGKPVQIVGLDTDISDIKTNESALERMTQKMRLALDVAQIGLWEFDVDTNTVDWDERVCEIYGIKDGAGVRPGGDWDKYIHPQDQKRVRAYADHCLENNMDLRVDFRTLRKGGDVRHIRTLARFFEDSGVQGRLLGVNIDLTEHHERAEALRRAQKQLEHDARHDVLTGLANRRLLDEATQTLLARIEPDHAWAVLHLDLDYFKQINDSLGHTGGDDVLVHLAHLLKGLVDKDGLVCRIGGDEFVILLERNATRLDVEALCDAVLERVAAPVIIQGQVCAFNVSIGAATGIGRTQDTGEVFINADVALYAAKSAGRGCYRVYHEGLRSPVQAYSAAQAGMEQALALGQMRCHYQPQFDPRTRAFVGCEALVRWDCPDRGLIGPDEFLNEPGGEGWALKVDAFMLAQVLEQQTQWFQDGLEVPMTALNLSAGRLTDASLFEQLRHELRPHHMLTFELLETAFWDEADPQLNARLEALRDLGIRIALDDFGSGRASVVALQRIQPDRVKIDRQLVSPLADKASQILTLKALVSLARLEGCEVVLEGVETEAQLEAVAALDCVAVQGFVLGAAGDAKALSDYLTPIDLGRSTA